MRERRRGIRICVERDVCMIGGDNMKKWTKEQQMKWQRECVLEDFKDIQREKSADRLDAYISRGKRRVSR